MFKFNYDKFATAIALVITVFLSRPTLEFVFIHWGAVGVSYVTIILCALVVWFVLARAKRHD